MRKTTGAIIVVLALLMVVISSSRVGILAFADAEKNNANNKIVIDYEVIEKDLNEMENYMGTTEALAENNGVKPNMVKVETSKGNNPRVNGGHSSNVSQASTTATKGEELGTFIVTAYCNCSKCQGKWVGQTASGRPPKAGRTIAVDPKVIKLGTKVNIPGLGERIAEDTGGAIKGNRIDVFMDSHSEAQKWGKKTITIYKK